jgi:methionine biosynthesis protein MetW
MRFDLEIIASWIVPGSRVLDLGCGEGDLLLHLKENRKVTGTGIELSEQKVAACIEKGLSVLQGDINKEVEDYADHSFDFVILSQTLQQVYEPDALIDELLRIGSKVVVSFPNFSHWSCRLQLFFCGQAPKTKQLPYQWYNTPNIRVITLGDFKRFAKDKGFKIVREIAINTQNQDKQGSIIHFFPNLRATYGIMLIGK